ncbi:hypothetical protein Ddc_14326 [Ditylenchus destructor]|nr:hypothetical protein Ddc_14326 [Ditylenchus destructor]
MAMDVFSTNAKNGKRLAESAYLAPFTQWQLKIGKSVVFMNAGHVILSARQPLTGHIITRVVPHRLFAMDNFTTISASAFCGESNEHSIYCLEFWPNRRQCIFKNVSSGRN